MTILDNLRALLFRPPLEVQTKCRCRAFIIASLCRRNILTAVLFQSLRFRMKSVTINRVLGVQTNSSPRPAKWRNNMFRLFTSAMLLTVAVVGDAFALEAVPAPEIGGGVVGTMVAAGVVYLINRRRSRS